MRLFRWMPFYFAFALCGQAADENPGYQPTVENAGRPKSAAPPGMVWIPGGTFSMGTADPTREVCGGSDSMGDARPIHRVYVDGFWMDATDVTNEQFAAFVAATNYVTVAERKPNAADFPGADPAVLEPGSVVFTPPTEPVPLDNPLVWWRYVPGASWRHPEGPASTLVGRENHPVVAVAYEDAVAYSAWAGKRLPTEAEWEFAARGGRAGEFFPWGKTLQPDHKWKANIFEGSFPDHNTREDGFLGTSPVRSFAPNPYGLYDMAGNVWAWCSDWYRPDTYEIQAREAQGGVIRNPPGPPASESYDPAEPGMPKRAQRGGSFLCTAQYCTRYILGSRGKGSPDTSSNHVGFRCVMAPKESNERATTASLSPVGRKSEKDAH